MKKHIQKQEILEGTLSCQHCLMIELHICSEHQSCKIVSKKMFLQLLLKTYEIGVELIPNIEQSFQVYWIDGVWDISQAIEIEAWNNSECGLCFIADFLDTPAAQPWLVGLKVSEENEAYKRSLDCMHELGTKTEEMEDWIEEMAIMYVKMSNEKVEAMTILK
jgi:hypothetical protein